MDAGGSIQHHRVADSKHTNLEMARTLFVSLNDSTPERRELSGTKHLWEEERFKGWGLEVPWVWGREVHDGKETKTKCKPHNTKP